MSHCEKRSSTPWECTCLGKLAFVWLVSEPWPNCWLEVWVLILEAWKQLHIQQALAPNGAYCMFVQLCQDRSQISSVWRCQCSDGDVCRCVTIHASIHEKSTEKIHTQKVLLSVFMHFFLYFKKKLRSRPVMESEWLTPSAPWPQKGSCFADHDILCNAKTELLVS